MDHKIKTKTCPKCGQLNVLRANFCTRRGCGFVFPKKQSSQKPATPEEPPKSTPAPTILNGDGDAPLLDFESISNSIVDQIIEIIRSCQQRQKNIGTLKVNTDDAIRKTYETYVANFDNMETSMTKIERLAQSLDDHYTVAENKLKHDLPARKKFLQLAYEEKKGIILPLVAQLVDGFTRIKPFNQCKGYQVSPLINWDVISAPVQLPQRFLYLGENCRHYRVLGEAFSISRRCYLELLNFQNLIIHFNNKNKDKATTLVSTLLSRVLKATQGQSLHICVIDPKMQLGLNSYFKTGLPTDIYSVERSIDTSDILEQETRILQMTKGESVERYNQSRHAGDNVIGYQIVVYQDWYSTLNGRIDEDELLDIVNNSTNAGYCFIFMVNDDLKPSGSVIRGRDEDDILSQLSHCTVINLNEQWAGDNQQLELMNDDQIFDILKEVRSNITPHSKDIDVGVLLEEKKVWGTTSSKNGFSLFIGKDSSLQDVQLDFEDDIIHQSLLVNYRSTKSNVFPWMNAMIAQVFTLYDPEELNVLVADFTGNEDIATLASKKTLLEPPFYYLGMTNSQTSPSKERIGNLIPRIISSLSNNPEKRLLAFIIGRDEDIKKYVIDKFYLTKDRLHIVLLTTDFVIESTQKQRAFEGYQLSFGPMRIESRSIRKEEKSESLRGDEFIFESMVCQAYTYSTEQTSHTIRQFVKEKPSYATLGQSLPQEAKEEAPKSINDCNTGHFAHNQQLPSSSDKTSDHTVNLIEVIEQPSSISIDTPREKTAIKESIEEKSCALTEKKENTVDVEVIPNTSDRIENKDKGIEVRTEADTHFNDGDTNYEVEKYDYQRVFQFFDYMLPETEWWKESCANVFEVPFGIHINREAGDKDEIRSLWFENSEAMANAALVLGGTGSGKTTFLQTLIVNAALRYSPQELEFYLIDFKKVGFLPFEKYMFPHARVVAGGADREFGLSILKSLEEELHKRMDNPGNYPRTILVIDECQDFFLGDKIDEEATCILEYILKKGRQFGINIILATQELQSSSTSIPSSLYESIAIRIVAKPNQRDYYGLFDRTSSMEMETLKRSYKKGELIYVTDTYMSSNSSIEDYHAKSFYIQYDDKDPDNSELKLILDKLSDFAKTHKDNCPKDKGMFVFHNDAPLVKFSITRMKDEHRTPREDLPKSIPVYLGVPIAIADDVFLNLSKDRNQNVLIIGASDAVVGQGIALNALVSSLVSYPKANRIDYVFDFTRQGEPLFGQLADIVKSPPFNPDSEIIFNKEELVVEKLKEIKFLLEKRLTRSQDEVDKHVFITIFGLDRGIMFGVDPTNTEGYFDAYLEATSLLNFIICNGPHYGVFTMVQFSGRLELLSQMLNIGSSYALFSHVVALQLEESESFSLMNDYKKSLYNKSAAQKNPGLYRALYYDRSNPGYILKFKPYKF